MKTSTNTATPNYSSKAAARKGATRKGLKIEKLDFFENDAGRWTWVDQNNDEMIKLFGVSHCPHCDTHLDNGVGEHGQDVNGTLIKHESHQFVCLACDGEFGPAIRKGATGTGVKIEKDRPEQNGVRRPSEGGKCRFVWDLCDALLKSAGVAPTPSVLKEEVAQANPDANLNNAVAELYQWRKFNGITGRVTSKR